VVSYELEQRDGGGGFPQKDQEETQKDRRKTHWTESTKVNQVLPFTRVARA